jgi:hypothetical protein
MPIEPIDLQVLFSRMPDVGKEQATQNELITGAQAAQAKELVKETDTRTNSVNESKETDEVRPTKEGEEGNAKGEGAKGRKRGKKKGKAPATFTDPQLGKNVDLSG